MDNAAGIVQGGTGDGLCRHSERTENAEGQFCP